MTDMITMRRVPAAKTPAPTDPGDVLSEAVFGWTRDMVRVGADGAVSYSQHATYPINIRGLGGRSVHDARRLRDALTAALDLADRPVEGPTPPPGIRLRCPGCGFTEWRQPGVAAPTAADPDVFAAEQAWSYSRDDPAYVLTCPRCNAQHTVTI